MMTGRNVLLKLDPVLFVSALLPGPSLTSTGPVNTGTTGQPSAPSLTPPSAIDPSSMQRAYAALGIPYQNTPSQVPQQQAQPRGINPMSKYLIPICMPEYFKGLAFKMFMKLVT